MDEVKRTDERGELTVSAVINYALQNGAKNIVPVAANYILWLLTIWIPYINIGTTIGVMVGLPAKAGRGEPISSTEIFRPEYRKQMGNFFLVEGLQMVGIMIGTMLFIIPGIIISIGWILATLIAVDQGEDPAKALTRSNEVTYGHKVTIFVTLLIVGVVIGVVVTILSAIIGALSETLATIVVAIVMAAAASFYISAIGNIYYKLAGPAR